MDIKKNPSIGSNGYLLRIPGKPTLEFVTEKEARVFMAKLETATAIVAVVQSLTTAVDGAGDRWQEYWDIRNTAGVFTDQDVAPLGITSAQLDSCISLLDAFGDFLTGADQGGAQVWRTSINQVRRVKLT
jgi:hypothetical protein